MKSFARGGGKKTPPLPKNWKLVKEKDGAFGKEKVYYYNTVTNQTSHEPPPPLPKGWKEALHKDSGRVYYVHKATRKTTFSFPTEEDGGPGDEDEEEEKDPGLMSKTLSFATGGLLRVPGAGSRASAGSSVGPSTGTRRPRRASPA